MKVSVPPLAAAIPPETGASTASSPRALAALATSRAVSTSIVEQSISSAPGRAAPNTVSVYTLATCLPAGSMVTTTSASLTACAASDTG